MCRMQPHAAAASRPTKAARPAHPHKQRGCVAPVVAKRGAPPRCRCARGVLRTRTAAGAAPPTPLARRTWPNVKTARNGRANAAPAAYARAGESGANTHGDATSKVATPALKEWNVVCEAVGNGDQTVSCSSGRWGPGVEQGVGGTATKAACQ